MGQPFKIETLTAFLAVSREGEEGVCAFVDPKTGVFMPMIGADHDRICSLRPQARAIAAATGQRIVLARFEARTDLEEIL